MKRYTAFRLIYPVKDETSRRRRDAHRTHATNARRAHIYIYMHAAFRCIAFRSVVQRVNMNASGESNNTELRRILGCIDANIISGHICQACAAMRRLLGSFYATRCDTKPPLRSLSSRWEGNGTIHRYITYECKATKSNSSQIRIHGLCNNL